VRTSAQRCQLIIKNLLEFSSGGVENHMQIVSMNEIVQKTLPLLKTLISQYEIDINLTDDKNTVAVEPHLMQQVVFNIINNAAQAMGDSGKLEIRTEIIRDGGTFVALSVKDTGAGIPAEIKNQIFDFFFTTKSQGQGTGLGLSISKNIVDRFNGRIDVKSDIGKGSVFTILLPQQDQST
jgi:two-component system, NtrC family, sensor kinase